MPKRNTGIVGFFSFIILVGGFYFAYSLQFESTQHAFLSADVTPIATEVDGKIEKIFVSENQHVSQGDLLFELDSGLFEIGVRRAKALVEEAQREHQEKLAAISSYEAVLKKNEIEHRQVSLSNDKINALAKKGYISTNDNQAHATKVKLSEATIAISKYKLEKAKRSVGENQENPPKLQFAKAELENAQWYLSRTQIVSPASGIVSHLLLRQGQMVLARQPQFAIVSQDHFWVEAYFKESQIAKIKPGQKAIISFARYPQYQFSGKVESILHPRDELNATPVKISVQGDFPYAPVQSGASATVRINTKSI